MPNTPTPILGLTVPTPAGDVGVWGNELNTDLAILDSLGALAIVSTAINYVAVVGVCPETLVRVTTGAATITVTLPAPAASNTGRVWTVKKVDSGGGSVSISATGGATIDGAASYSLAAQYKYVRICSNGVTYDVVGNN
jgi:hypothetical protein